MVDEHVEAPVFQVPNDFFVTQFFQVILQGLACLVRIDPAFADWRFCTGQRHDFPPLTIGLLVRRKGASRYNGYYCRIHTNLNMLGSGKK